MPPATATDDAIYELVRQRICRVASLTGRCLSRRKLAQELSVPLGSVRTALHRLEGEGLVESRPKSGTVVREIDHAELRHHYDLRELIEPYAAARAAKRISRMQLDRLEES